MKFYLKTIVIYHNKTCIGIIQPRVLLEKEPHSKTFFLTWDNLTEYVSLIGAAALPFTIWIKKKGRVVEFLPDRGEVLWTRDARSVKEWRSALNIRIEVTYTEFTPSFEDVLNWHDAESAIKYLNERGLKGLNLPKGKER